MMKYASAQDEGSGSVAYPSTKGPFKYEVHRANTRTGRRSTAPIMSPANEELFWTKHKDLLGASQFWLNGHWCLGLSYADAEYVKDLVHELYRTQHSYLSSSAGTCFYFQKRDSRPHRDRSHLLPLASHFKVSRSMMCLSESSTDN
ncbi:hypothetical protein BDN71DRAFT_1178941 [Pleurotus eryngii]|uniref:Uncharacterized protein n=1 Tax=Pleurotus eryngii TaxID=5323 RepID=A0A9P5ZUQ7_PLEER|nr:hypothetical protein BDN71DRAFT_1178941 [Pleurotus eryngii]